MPTDWGINHKYLLWRGGLLPALWNKNRPAGPFCLEQDCVGIETPPNLHYPTGLGARCLIWRWRITREGYGIMSLADQPNKRVKVHRLTYACSREVPVRDVGPVLHMCHRPYCVQPAHLYEGTPHDNRVDTSDRKRLVPKGGWSSISQHFDRGGDSAQYLWQAPSPPSLPAGVTVLPPSKVPCHDHVGGAPAGDGSICNTCGLVVSTTPCETIRIPIIQFGDRGQTLYVPDIPIALTGWAADNLRAWWKLWFPDKGG